MTKLFSARSSRPPLIGIHLYLKIWLKNGVDYRSFFAFIVLSFLILLTLSIDNFWSSVMHIYKECIWGSYYSCVLSAFDVRRWFYSNIICSWESKTLTTGHTIPRLELCARFLSVAIAEGLLSTKRKTLMTWSSSAKDV